jgi:hypothetical protein
MSVETESKRRERELEHWRALVKQLVDQVRTWARDRGWPVTESERRIEESRYGVYVLPELAIRAPSGTAYLEPVARDVAGAQGRVDLLAWPSLTRMMLVREGDRWVLQTDSGVEWPERWGRQTFEKVVNLINAAA